MNKLESLPSLGALGQIRKKFGREPHKGLAEYCWPNGSVIRCLPCDISRNCTTAEITGWLQNGMPRCRKCNCLTSLDNPK